MILHSQSVVLHDDDGDNIVSFNETDEGRIKVVGAYEFEASRETVLALAATIVEAFGPKQIQLPTYPRLQDPYTWPGVIPMPQLPGLGLPYITTHTAEGASK